MNRFFGRVGYAQSVRSGGVVRDVITERSYYGEKLRNVRRFSQEDSVLGKISYNTRLSIMADAFALENYQDIRYVEWAGSLWIVEEVETERPRLILTLGEKYNGPVPEVTNG